VTRKFTFAIAALAMLVVPSTASATVSCSFVGGALSITINNVGSTFSAAVHRNGANLEVLNQASSPVACAPGGADINNTNLITFDETTAAQGTSMTVRLDGGRLEPGLNAGAETGTAEIEVSVLADGTGNDILAIDGATESAAQNFRFGEVGGPAIDANLNGDDDSDDIHATGVDHVVALGGSGNGTITADGTGGSFAGPMQAALTANGGAGDDTITGTTLTNANRLTGGLNNDTLTGGAGSDELDIAQGNDTADGKGGSADFASYAQFNTLGVTLDLGQAGPQDTGGGGTDTVANLENIVGSNGSDRLTGTGGPNEIFGGNDPGDLGDDILNGAGGGDTLWGRPGNDVLIGGQGDDVLVGEAGNDTASYASGSTGPVTVDLDLALTGVPQATGGAGADTLSDSSDPDPDHEIENLIGSPFGGDSLTGNTVANVLTGYGDGLLDTIDCVAAGDGDTAILDELGVESSTNCETVDNAPQTGINAGPTNGSTVADSTPTYGLTTDEGAPISFQFSIDGGTFTTCAASCDVSTLADGPHTLRFRAVDGDENQNPDPTPAQRTVTIDTTGPTVSIDERPLDATSDNTPTWKFSSTESPVTFECIVDSVSQGTCSSPFTSATLVDGSHNFRVVGRDALNNAGPVVSDDVTVDTVGPAIQIDERPADPTNSTNPIWKFSSAEGGLTFECQVDGAGFAPCNATVAHSAGSLPDGPHTFAVRGRDSLGNAGPTLTDAFTVDKTGPAIQISQRPADVGNDNTPTWQFSSGEADVTYTCIIDGGDPAPCSGPGASHTAGALSDGAHLLVVIGRDALGNQGDAVTDQFSVDTRSPNTDAPGRIKTRKKREKVPFGADEQQVTFECSFDGAAFGTCTSPFRTPKMKRPSKHRLEIRAIDQAGNVDESPGAVAIKRKR
jgi:Ca2+-binding RTX toxin-like protein